MANIDRVLETCLYVTDMAAAKQFYSELFCFPVLFSDERITAFDVAGAGVLLLFTQGMTLQPVQTSGGTVPPHDGSGSTHFAFAIAADQYDAWKQELLTRNIVVESEVRWPRGGRNLYFRDPDNNLVELATPGLWTTY